MRECVWAQYLPRTALVKKERKGSYRVTYRSSSNTYELDNSDRYILSQLSKNSRVSATALSAGLRASENCSPLSVDTVTNRIKKFEKDGIISGYGVLLNPDALSQLGFKVLLFLNALPNEKLEAIIRTCQLDSRVIHIIKTICDRID